MISILGDGYRIKVTTEHLRNTAKEADCYVRKLAAACDDLNDAVAATGNYWYGKAGNMKRADFNSKKETIEDILKRLNRYSSDLMSISETYEGAEGQNVGSSESLSEDVII